MEKAYKPKKVREELMPFSRRLGELLHALNLEQQALAQVAKKNKGTITEYLQGKSQPNQDVVGRWVKKYNVNANWLLTGEGPMFRKEEQVPSGPAYEIKRLGHNGHVRRAEVIRGAGEVDLGYLIDVHAEAGAGPASLRWEPEAIASVCIPPEYYRPGVFGLRIRGGSMEPLISRGAFVGVDSDDRDFVAGDIYAVFIPQEGLTVKRLFVDPAANEYVLHSVNPDHPDMRLPVDQSERLIVGRVVWVLQKF